MTVILIKIIKFIKKKFLKEWRNHFDEIQYKFKKFKKLHKKKFNQTIHFSQNCKNYNFIENFINLFWLKKIVLYLNLLRKES